MRWVPASLVVASGLGLSTPAGAEPVSLSWESEDGCGSKEELRQGAERLLGAPLDELARRPLSFSASVAATKLRVETRDGESVGSRTLDGEDCDDLKRAAALLLALLIDPEKASGSAPSTRPEIIASVPVTPPTPARQQDPLPAPPPPLSLRATPLQDQNTEPVASNAAPSQTHPGVGRVAVVGSAGDVPGPALGVRGVFGVQLESWRWTLGATFLPPRRAAAAADTGRGGEVGLWALDLQSCYRVLSESAHQLSPCAGFEGGALYGRGYGVAQPDRGQTPWLAGTLAALWRVRLNQRVFLSLSGAALFPLARPRFVLDELGPVHRPAAVVGRAELGAEVEF